MPKKADPVEVCLDALAELVVFQGHRNLRDEFEILNRAGKALKKARPELHKAWKEKLKVYLKENR